MIHSAAARTGIASYILGLIDAGSAGGKIKARTGSGGTLLATWTFDTTSGIVSGAVLAGSSFPKEVNASANGTIGWVEITDDADTIILSTADVGTGSEQASFSSLAAVSGSPIRINSFTYTVPAGT
jgi:hypothetical protein